VSQKNILLISLIVQLFLTTKPWKFFKEAKELVEAVWTFFRHGCKSEDLKIIVKEAVDVHTVARDIIEYLLQRTAGIG